MASLSLFCCTPQSIKKLGFHPIPSSSLSSSSSSLSLHTCRFKNAAKLLTFGRRLHLVHASSKPSEEPIIANKKDAISSGGNTSTAKGPPFLTILAGIAVFALLLWLIGSLLSWLIGLIGLIFSK